MWPRFRDLFLVLSCVSSLAGAMPVSREPLWGYVDKLGRIVVEPAYTSEMSIFNGDWVGVTGPIKSGYLNLSNGATTGMVFDGVADDLDALNQPLFSIGPEPAFVGGKWGYTDQSGKLVIAARFTSAKQFTADGLAVIELDGKHGFIDRHGKVVMVPQADFLASFKNGLARFKVGQLFGAIDVRGTVVFPPSVKALEDFSSNGLAAASPDYQLPMPPAYKSSSHWGYVNRTGRFVIAPTFSYASNFFDDADSEINRTAPDRLARVSFDANGAEITSYIDVAGKTQITLPSGYTGHEVGRNNMILVQDRRTAKWGFANASGEIVVPARYDSASAFAPNGLAAVEIDGSRGYIDFTGKLVLPAIYESAGLFDETGFATVTLHGQSERIDAIGHVVGRLPSKWVGFFQKSGFAAFKYFPPQIDYPSRSFGRWRVDRMLYAVPEVPPLGPSPIGRTSVSAKSKDGRLQWSVWTVGWTLNVQTETTDQLHTRSSAVQLPGFPADADAILKIMIDEFDGKTGTQLRIESGNPNERAEQSLLERELAASRLRYQAELNAGKNDFARALAAMEADTKDQFGDIAGKPPCTYPQCVY